MAGGSGSGVSGGGGGSELRRGYDSNGDPWPVDYDNISGFGQPAQGKQTPETVKGTITRLVLFAGKLANAVGQ